MATQVGGRAACAAHAAVACQGQLLALRRGPLQGPLDVERQEAVGTALARLKDFGFADFWVK